MAWAHGLPLGGVLYERYIQLQWDSYPESIGYNVYRSVNQEEYSIVSHQDTADSFNHFIDIDVSTGNNYAYYITACGSDWETAPSEILNRNTWLPCPYIINPEDGATITNPTPTFTWTPAGITSFPYGNIYSASSVFLVHKFISEDESTETVCRIDFPDLTTSTTTYDQDEDALPLVAGNYYDFNTLAWGFDESGTVIAQSCSPIRRFYYAGEENGASLGQVQLISPSDGATLPPGDITFSWNPVSNATKYQFILYNSLGQVALDAIDSGTSSIVGLDIEETITWKIRAGDNSGNWGAWSSTWSLTIKSTTSYALRDIGPAGGYIFYDKGYYSSGWRYLEAAPVSTEWTDKEWGSCQFLTYGNLIGGTEMGIGTGQSNTTKIVTWLNSHSETDRVAQLCDALVYGGCSDWFLPSLDELNLMRENLYLEGVGGFVTDNYWSSSEYSAINAWRRGFAIGGQGNWIAKYATLRVRAVRAF